MIMYKDNDGAAWIEGDTIVINIKWLNLEEEAEWYIDESFIHEYVEHVLGLGHAAAVYVEKLLRNILYTEWFGVHPLKLLYGSTRVGGGSLSGDANQSLHVQAVHGVYQQFLSQHQGV